MIYRTAMSATDKQRQSRAADFTPSGNVAQRPSRLWLWADVGVTKRAETFRLSTWWVGVGVDGWMGLGEAQLQETQPSLATDKDKQRPGGGSRGRCEFNN